MTKAFTLYALALNNLGHTGEGVKAKNKNCLTRARGAPLRSSPRTDAHSHSQPGKNARCRHRLTRSDGNANSIVRCCPMLGNETSRQCGWLLASTETSAAGQKRSIPRTNSCRWNAFAISEETGRKIGASAPRRFTHCLLRLPRRRFRYGDGRVGWLPTTRHYASGRSSDRSLHRGVAEPGRVCRENRGWSTAWWGAVACATAK